MAEQEQNNRVGDWLKWELVVGDYSRDQVTIDGTITAPSADVTLRTGTVLGKVTASGKYAPHDPAESNGLEVAAGVLVLDNKITTTTDKEVGALVRLAIIGDEDLTFVNAVDSGEKAAALAALQALGIVNRDQPVRSADITHPIP